MSTGVPHVRVAVVRVIMKAGALEEAKSYTPHFVVIYGAIGVKFDAQDKTRHKTHDTRQKTLATMTLLCC